MAFVANIIARVGADISEFQKQMKAAQKTMERAGNNLKNIGANLSTFVTAPIVAAGGAAIKLASDMEESLNKVKVAFKDSSKDVISWSNTTLKSFGIAQGTALDMAALFGDMGTAMGQTPKEAAKMSTALVGLAGDLASFKNIGIEQAQDALKGVFTGEGESLKTLGVIMQDSTLKAYALATGQKKSYDEMTQAEKVALRYSFVMDATKNAQGDFARTNDGAANQMRIFQEGLKELGAQIGQIMLPTFTKLTTKLNEIIQWFGELSPQAKQFIVVAGLIAAALGPLIFIVGTLITSFGAIAGAIAAISAPVLIVVGTLAALTAAFVYLWNTNEGFRNFIKAAWENIKSFLLTTWSIIKEVAMVVWGALKAFWEQNGNGIKEMFVSIWDFIWNVLLKPIWALISLTAKLIFNDLKKYWEIWGTNIVNVFKIAWDTIKDVFGGAVQIITGLFQVLEGIFTLNWTKMWEGAKNIFVGIWDSIVSIFKGVINSLINGLNALIRGLNKLRFSTPDWIPLIGGKQWSFNIPQIPMLASGGIVNGATLAMIGESGAEAVVPLENDSFIDIFASKVGSAILGAMQFGSSQSKSGDIVLQIDGTQFARIINPYQAKENERIGNKLIIQGV